MRNTLTIACKEMRSYFVSPMAYVVMFFYLGVCGLIFALSVSSPQAMADMRGLFGTMVFITLMIAPVLTMGLLAQEQATGSIELLMTNPVREWEVVLGKYLAALGLFTLLLALSLEFPLIMEKYGDPDWGAVAVGYLGVLLAGAAFIAISLFASSLTSNQVAAAIIGAFMLLFFWLVGWISMAAGDTLGDIAKHVSIFNNFQDFDKGIVDSKPIVYFASLTGFALFLAVRSLENRRTI